MAAIVHTVQETAQCKNTGWSSTNLLYNYNIYPFNLARAQPLLFAIHEILKFDLLS